MFYDFRCLMLSLSCSFFESTCDDSVLLCHRCCCTSSATNTLPVVVSFVCQSSCVMILNTPCCCTYLLLILPATSVSQQPLNDWFRRTPITRFIEHGRHHHSVDSFILVFSLIPRFPLLCLSLFLVTFPSLSSSTLSILVVLLFFLYCISIYFLCNFISEPT